eukprot:11045037-Prorocentrum_lima.AAC.1
MCVADLFWGDSSTLAWTDEWVGVGSSVCADRIWHAPKTCIPPRPPSSLAAKPNRRTHHNMV